MSAHIRPYDPKDYEEVKNIFFESSTKKDFKSEGEKEAFLEKYLGFYLSTHPENAYVAWDEKILGYVVFATDSSSSKLLDLQPHLKSFEKSFSKFPAHLHINCHHEARGLGIGSKLILECVKRLQSLNIIGLHIMTSPDSQNRSFYKKLGFNSEVIESFQNSPILFMGKDLRMNKL